MSRSLFATVSLCMLPVCGHTVAGAAAVAEERVAAQHRTAHELLTVCNDMWIVLSGVSDKKSADAAAPEFRCLMDKAQQVSEKLYCEGGQDLEIITELHDKLAESLDELTLEFESICELRCYASSALKKEFIYAVEVGMFAEDCLVMLADPLPVMTEAEMRGELLRFTRLLEHDRAILEALRMVQDAATSLDAAKRLHSLTDHLNALAPAKALADRKFSQASRSKVRRAYSPIEPVLWGIRTEIVRIAALPGYHGKDFDSFSLALENMFLSLCVTHSHFIEEVFDDSFHTDLDEALSENATTSK
ncbi:MAG: hypothetical protein E7033_03740 [Akkermansiaceae bacterium]|nr:hypothetical protein [Akkermansiaceae bacterium]